MSPSCLLVARRTLAQIFSCAGVLFLCGCITAPNSKDRLRSVSGESSVFVGEEPARFAFLPDSEKPIRLRNTYLPGANTIVYEPGRDYVISFADGTLRRTAQSRIPDFRTNMLHGQQEFDHSKFPGFGNTGFFAFADYSPAKAKPWPVKIFQSKQLERTRTRLTGSERVKIVAFGDSITAGGDATQPRLIFWQRWADELQKKYPAAKVQAINGATGGDSTAQGLQRLQHKVIDEKPDLVLIGFGMNDHNKNGVPIPEFEANLKGMVARIRAQTSAEIILFSAFPPNPQWKFGTHRMADYAAATERTARAMNCAYADVFSNWQILAARKKPEDFLGNNINHPNDFGHWIYFRVFSGLGL